MSHFRTVSDHYYDVVAVRGETREHHDLGTQSPLGEGEIIPLDDEDWIVDRLEPGGEGGRPLVTAKPVRYRLTLRHAPASEHAGGFHDAAGHRPDVGYRFDTGPATGWTVIKRSLKRDRDGEPYIDLIAARQP